MNRELVFRVESPFGYPEGTAEVTLIRLLPFREFISPVVRWEAVCVLLGASSAGPEIGPLLFSATPPSCLDFLPCVGTIRL